MRTLKPSALLQQKISSTRETVVQQRERERKSMEVASQMLRNGCCANTVSRYTGLPEDTLRQIQY